MSVRLFLVESDQAGLRAALLDGRRLDAVEIDRTGRLNRAGSVVAAKLVRTIPGLGSIAAVADGTEFLLDHAETQAKSGAPMTVQIRRGARDGKLGVASRAVTLAGRGVVHLPLEAGVRFSRRLNIHGGQRAAFEALVAGRPGGWIFRRNAVELDMADLAGEIATLGTEGQRPELGSPDAFRRLANDYAAVPPGRILVAGLAARRSAERWCQMFAPSLLARIEPVEAGLFDLYDLDDAITSLADKNISLAGGASLVVEPTEALTAIDVNAGAEGNILSVNLLAAAEIGRQLRLRHIGGIVVIDFISMTRPRDRDRVVEALKAAVADDPAQTYIVPMSALDLVEMTRERHGPGLEFAS